MKNIHMKVNEFSLKSNLQKNYIKQEVVAVIENRIIEPQQSDNFCCKIEDNLDNEILYAKKHKPNRRTRKAIESARKHESEKFDNSSDLIKKLLL